MAGSTEAGLARLNALPDEAARDAFLRCCGCERWAGAMVSGRPYPDARALRDAADAAWAATGPAEWLEAFRHHPRIGDRAALAARFAATRSWSAGEQGGVADAGDAVLDALHAGNLAYEARFGHVFLVCATGKSAGELLDLLRRRLHNAPDEELRVAAAEQARITRLRLEKLLQEP
jgi:2-oxo-4-hydroxy-4-carboxy-5-ureidoimidazoline decarboxylase